MAYISAVTVLIPDYEQAIEFYVGVLGFELVEDTDLGGGKRWVLVAPKGSKETRVLLAKASNDEQRERIGKQTGGRVGFFLRVDDFDAALARLAAHQIHLHSPPRSEPYGQVAVFKDPWGNLWDLLGPPRTLA
jgi:catechol 2,3-dioxygenase-like lactoylglutathione lyase family enzyme